MMDCKFCSSILFCISYTRLSSRRDVGPHIPAFSICNIMGNHQYKIFKQGKRNQLIYHEIMIWQILHIIDITLWVLILGSVAYVAFSPLSHYFMIKKIALLFMLQH